MSLPTQTKQWVLSHKPTDFPILSGPDSTFTLRTADLPPLAENQVLLQTLYLSNDPAQRAWIRRDAHPDRMYRPPVQEGEVMPAARAICKVLASNAAQFKQGQTVSTGASGWQEYAVVDAAAVLNVPAIPGVAATQFLGSLGGTGLTAYYGLVEVARATAKDFVVVSGAAGATGSMVVQIAKGMLGCRRVVGIAGGREKCAWVESLGADVCVDYKAPGFQEDLVKATEGYVDVYFDNVGGEQLDLMLTRMGKYGRVAACGAISNYNEATPTGLKNWAEIITCRIEVRGFIVMDLKDFPGTIGKLVGAVREGKIKVGDENETVVESKWEDVPKTWTGLFEGRNRGKLVTKIVD